MLKGDLSSFSLGEILQSLAINNHTGTLKLVGPEGDQRLIYFAQGNIRKFSTGKPEELQVGPALVRMQLITADDLSEIRTREELTHGSIGLALLRKGLVTKEDIDRALTMKIQEEIFDLFLWTSGHFEFEIDHCPEELFDDLQKTTSAAVNTNSVIMEGLRRVDEWQVIRQHIPTFDVILVATGTPEQSGDELNASFFEKIDGERSVRDLEEFYYGTRFELCKCLVDRLTEGSIRPLTVEECLAGAEAHQRARTGNAATRFLRFASRLAPNDPRIWVRLGHSLAEADKDDESRECLFRAFELTRDDPSSDLADKLADQLTASERLLSVDQLRALYDHVLSRRDVERSSTVATGLARRLQRDGQLDEAAAVLSAVIELDPDDLNLMIEIGTLYQKADEIEKAAEYFESVAAALEEQGKHRDLLKILRILQNLAPKNVELKQRISATQAKIDQLEARKKRRLKILAISGSIAAVLLLVPIVYEWKARELYNAAMRLEEVSRISLDFSEAKERYEEVIQRYSLSTRAADAHAAIERISAFEAARVATVKHAERGRIEQQNEERRRRREEFRAGVEQLEVLLRDGELQAAHDLATAMRTQFTSIAEAAELPLPLRISSSPPGASLLVKRSVTVAEETRVEESRRETPWIVQYLPGEELEITAALKGCKTVRMTLELVDQVDVVIRLERTPSREFHPAIALEQQPLIAKNRLIAVSRDGNLYGIDPARGKTADWKRTVGRFGDRVSDLAVHGSEVYLATVAGEATAISTLNKKSRWVVRLDGSVLAAPAISADGRWVAIGTTRGSISLIDNRAKTIAATFATENSIKASPVFYGSKLIAASSDNGVYFFHLPSKSLEKRVDVRASVDHSPVVVSSIVVVAGNDGRIQGLSLDSGNRRPLWSTPLESPVSAPLIAVGDTVHAGTARGRIVELDPKTGAIRDDRTIDKTPIAGLTLHEEVLYACVDGGRLFALDADSLETLWTFDTGTPIRSSPLVYRRQIYVPSANGRFLVFDLL